MANPCIRFTLGSHVWFRNLDFICTGVDYDLVLLPPDVDVDAISDALSILCLGMSEGRHLIATAQEVPKAKQRHPVSHMTMEGPVASLQS
jgi:hypothetical protein